MKVYWCWRCQADVPMLERHEWEVIEKARGAKSKGSLEAALAMLESEAERLGIDPPLKPPTNARPITRWYWELIAGYHMFTGVLLDSPNPVWHHVISEYGPPCVKCGKLLRTKAASYCAACGTPVAAGGADDFSAE